MYTRRDFMKLSTLFTASAALPLLQACGKNAAMQPDAPLAIGYLPIVDAAPLLVAYGKGLFAQHDIKAQKPVLFRSWAGLVEAFLSGQVNLIHVLSPMSVWMRYGSRAPVHALMWNHVCGSALTVRPDVNALAEAKGVGKILRFSGDIWRDHACCLSMMHDHDIQSRPQWVQNVINALGDAAAFAKHHRSETAEMLAKQGIRHYTPHDAKVLRAVLQPEPIVWQKYERTGAIRHADWQQRRVDFQPFPFQSYSELLVKLLKETHLAGVNTFLNDVQPEKAARELFDTRFVERALQRDGLMSSFGLQSLQRQEAFAL